MDKIKKTLELAKDLTYADDLTEGARMVLRVALCDALDELRAIKLCNSEENIPDDLYKLITWPQTEFIIDKIWYDECIVINTEALVAKHGFGAYLVPLKRYEEYLKK